LRQIPDSEQTAILFAEECDRGIQREENQASILHVRISLGELLIVADGIGKSTGGAIASRLVVESFYTHLVTLPHNHPADEAIREAAAIANQRILEAAKAPDSLNAQMASTVVVVLVQQDADVNHALVGHIGDSRAYLLRAERLYRLTTDHSAAQSLVDWNLITPEEAQHHPDATVMTRSLGLNPKVEIDIEDHPLATGDTLMLCSHGLWGPVPEKEIEAAVAGEALGEAAHKLLELALAAGGRDGIAIEMARLMVPTPPVAPRKGELPFAFKWVVIIFLMAIAGLCVLLYTVFLRH
jgi:serine/threonine protein phosphatase PrpC